MKLESTLPERPGFLIVVPAINLFALLLVFFLPSFFSQAGVAVELPVSRFQLERQADSTVITVRPGDPPEYWLERQQVSINQLSESLDARRGGDASSNTTVLLRVDKGGAGGDPALCRRTGPAEGLPRLSSGPGGNGSGTRSQRHRLTMFGLRSKRTNRDRESGLVFQWRLPVGNSLSFFAAIGLVALITAGLAATVRVRIGGSVHHPERRGSLILVPHSDEWRALELMAMEQGPIPLREDPSNDPAIRSLIQAGMAGAAAPGYRYQPRFQPVPVKMSSATAVTDFNNSPGMLPPLPQPEPPAQNPALPDPSRPVILSTGGLHAIAPEEMPPASLLRGNRYLLGYGQDGQVNRVTTLFSGTPGTDATAAEAWLRRVKIEDGAKDGGWTAVEISCGP